MSSRRASPFRTGATILLCWIAAALAAAVQQTAADGLAGRDATRFWHVLGVQAELLWAWALATPGILWSARRFPVAGARRLRNFALHVAAGSAFVFIYNVIIRLPGAPASPAAPADLWRESLRGFASWYHLALIVYLAIVALGHARLRSVRVLTRRSGTVDGARAMDRGDPDTGNARESGRRAASEAVQGRGGEIGAGAGDTAGRPADRRVDDAAAAPDGGGRVNGPPRLAVRTGTGIRLIPADEIDWIEADNNHVRIHAGDRAHRARERLGELEDRLGPAGFVRIHRSLLVRSAAVRELRPAERGDYTVVLHSGRELRLARTRAAALEALVGDRL